MTLQEWAIKQLTSRGMLPDQALKVLAQYKERSEAGALVDAWNQPIEKEESYLLMLVVIRDGLLAEGLLWIDANLPQAFFRPMFAQRG